MRPFYTLFILSTNSFGDFGVDRAVMPNLECCYRDGQDLISHPDVYGYVITKTNEDSWQVINETVYGCSYTIYEHNGSIRIKEGKSNLVLV